MKVRWLCSVVPLRLVLHRGKGRINASSFEPLLGSRGSKRSVTAIHCCKTAPSSTALMVHSTNFSWSLPLLT